MRENSKEAQLAGSCEPGKPLILRIKDNLILLHTQEALGSQRTYRKKEMKGANKQAFKCRKFLVK